MMSNKNICKTHMTQNVVIVAADAAWYICNGSFVSKNFLYAAVTTSFTTAGGAYVIQVMANSVESGNLSNIQV